MGQLKHTPGPWRLGRAGVVVSNSSEGITIGGATGKENTDYYGGNLICESVSLGNAKLIATAPEMLESLIEVIRLRGLIEYSGMIDEEHEQEAIAINSMLSNIDNLIKKATE